MPRDRIHELTICAVRTAVRANNQGGAYRITVLGTVLRTSNVFSLCSFHQHVHFLTWSPRATNKTKMSRTEARGLRPVSNRSSPCDVPPCAPLPSMPASSPSRPRSTIGNQRRDRQHLAHVGSRRSITPHNASVGTLPHAPSRLQDHTQAQSRQCRPQALSNADDRSIIFRGPPDPSPSGHRSSPARCPSRWSWTSCPRVPRPRGPSTTRAS